MQQPTRGIVINKVDYNDRYCLVQIYTQHFGLTCYMLPKTRAGKVALNKNLFAPLASLALVVVHRPNRPVQRITEAHICNIRPGINADIKKMSTVFFIADFLQYILKAAETDVQHTFAFIEQGITFLNDTKKSSANFHIVFLLKLTHLLGIFPNLEHYHPFSYFDMRQGEFCIIRPLHKQHLDILYSRYLNLLKRINYHNMHLFRLNSEQRKEIIEIMLDYYRIHVQDFPDLKSLDVLNTLFR